jgi:hypothetical protein
MLFLMAASLAALIRYRITAKPKAKADPEPDSASL